MRLKGWFPSCQLTGCSFKQQLLEFLPSLTVNLHHGRSTLVQPCSATLSAKGSRRMVQNEILAKVAKRLEEGRVKWREKQEEKVIFENNNSFSALGMKKTQQLLYPVVGVWRRCRNKCRN